MEDDLVVGFGNVLGDDKQPKAQTEKRGNRYYVYPIDKDKVERKWRYARQSVEEIKHLLRAKKTKDGCDIEIGKDFETIGKEPNGFEKQKHGQNCSTRTNCMSTFPKLTTCNSRSAKRRRN